MFEWSGWCVRRSLPFGLILLLAFLSFLEFSQPLLAQEAENPNAGTVQGTVRDEDGVPVESARISYSSEATDTRGVIRSAKDGTYVTEQLPPGSYVVHVDGRDLLPAEVTVTVNAGVATTVDFKLDWISPGPDRPSSHFTSDAPNQFPINGRNYLTPGEVDPGVQVVDGAIYDPGKSGFQSLSIDSWTGRTTHYDLDEVESMDETKGAAEMTLPVDSVREVTVSRATPELFQSLNATGSVQVTTRTGADAWHGNVFGNLRDLAVGVAGYPSGNAGYSRQQYGFGGGGPLIKDKAFLFVAGERTKQDGSLPMMTQDLILPSANGSPIFNTTGLTPAYFRENLALARLDYSHDENLKYFLRLGYDNANLLGANSESVYRNQINVPSAAFGLDWNNGKYVHSARFGYQKLVNAVTPDLGASAILPSDPYHMQIGSFSLGPSISGPRQTVQRDLFARWDSSTIHKVDHTIRFGGAFHYIQQNDYLVPGSYGPSVTSSNGLATINAVNANPNLSPLYPGDLRGAADNPLNYPVGSFTIYNGLGNFSDNSALGRPTGGHTDYRFEGYVGDKWNVIPNVNVSFGVNYVLDTARTDSDIAPIPCSAINTNIVTSPPCTGNFLILDQYGEEAPNGSIASQTLGTSISRPYRNVSPQLGVAWDPGHNGRTVVRASGGLFYDNFLFQNIYQDRINRLSRGQFNRSLTLCPAGSILFPDGSLVSSVNGVDIASQICGQPIGQVSSAIQALQSDFTASQAALPAGAPNAYSLASLADFGGMLAPGFKTPRVVHMSIGLERQISDRTTVSVDYVREIGTQFPLGIDTNHVGDATFMTDGDNPNVALNTYAAELSAINNTILANPLTNGTLGPLCPFAAFAGGSSQTAVQCYINQVPTAGIADFARQGLDSSSAFCGPFACSVLGKKDATTGQPLQASFGGINPNVGSNIMYFPSGRSLYQGIHFLYHTTSAPNPMRRVQRIDVSIAYTLSRYRSNIAQPNGSGGDYSILNVAEDYLRPHLGHFGVSGLDRTHQIVLTPTIESPYGPRLSLITLLGSPLPLSASVPQMYGGGVPGELFRSDLSGDGTVGDLIAGTFIGSTGKYSSTDVNKAIRYYNQNVAGHLTPAGGALANAALFSSQQLLALGAYSPIISSCTPPNPSCGVPGRWAGSTWFKTVDLRLSWPFSMGERAKIEPNVGIFNVFNLSNYGGAGNQLSGVLDGAPGTSLNNSTSPGTCGTTTSFCTSRLDRVLPGSGTYANGAPRQLQFGVRITF